MGLKLSKVLKGRCYSIVSLAPSSVYSDLASWCVPHILNPIKFVHSECVDTLVDTCHRGGSTTGGDRVTRRIRLQMDVLVVLDDILLDIVFSLRTAFLVVTWG